MTAELIVTAVFVVALVGLTFGIQALLIAVIVITHLVRFLALVAVKAFCLAAWVIWWLRDRDAAMRSWRATA